MEPRYYSVTEEFPANDQHPSHDIEEGEKLIKWAYETVRSSPAWNGMLVGMVMSDSDQKPLLSFFTTNMVDIMTMSQLLWESLIPTASIVPILLLSSTVLE